MNSKKLEHGALKTEKSLKVMKILTFVMVIVALILFVVVITSVPKLKKAQEARKARITQLETRVESDSTTSANRLVMIQGLNKTVAIEKQKTARADSLTGVWKSQASRNTKAGKKALDALKATHEASMKLITEERDSLLLGWNLDTLALGKLKEKHDGLVKKYGEQGKELSSWKRKYTSLGEFVLNTEAVIDSVETGRKARGFGKWFNRGRIFVLEEPGEDSKEINWLYFEPKGRKKFIKK